MPRGCPSQDRHSKCPRRASCSCAVRPPTRESASARLNEIAFTYGDERATLAMPMRGTGPRWLRRLAIGWPQDNASERCAERSLIVEASGGAGGGSTPAISSASARKAEAHRPPYLRDGDQHRQ